MAGATSLVPSLPSVIRIFFLTLSGTSGFYPSGIMVPFSRGPTGLLLRFSGLPGPNLSSV